MNGKAANVMAKGELNCVLQVRVCVRVCCVHEYTECYLALKVFVDKCMYVYVGM